MTSLESREPMVAVENLTRRFGDAAALDDQTVIVLRAL